MEQLAAQRLPLKKRLLSCEDDDAPSAVEAATLKQHPWLTSCNRWQIPSTPMRQSRSKANEGRLAGEAAEEGTNEP